MVTSILKNYHHLCFSHICIYANEDALWTITSVRLFGSPLVRFFQSLNHSEPYLEGWFPMSVELRTFILSEHTPAPYTPHCFYHFGTWFLLIFFSCLRLLIFCLPSRFFLQLFDVANGNAEKLLKNERIWHVMTTFMLLLQKITSLLETKIVWGDFNVFMD